MSNDRWIWVNQSRLAGPGFYICRIGGEVYVVSKTVFGWKVHRGEGVHRIEPPYYKTRREAFAAAEAEAARIRAAGVNPTEAP